MVLLLRDQDKAEIIATISAIEVSLATYHNNFLQCLKDFDSRMAKITNTSPSLTLSLPPQPTTPTQPTFEDLLRKFEIAMSVSATSKPDIGLVAPIESLPSSEPSPETESIAFSDESDTLCQTLDPTAPSSPLKKLEKAFYVAPVSTPVAQTEPIPQIKRNPSLSSFPLFFPNSHLCCHRGRLSHRPTCPTSSPTPSPRRSTEPPRPFTFSTQVLRCNRMCCPPPPNTQPPCAWLLLRASLLRPRPVTEVMPTTPASAPPRYFQIYRTGPILKVFHGRAAITWTEEPPGSWFFEHPTLERSLLAGRAKSFIRLAHDNRHVNLGDCILRCCASVSWIEDPSDNEVLHLDKRRLFPTNSQAQALALVDFGCFQHAVSHCWLSCCALGKKFTALIFNSVVITSLSAVLLATNNYSDKPSGVSRVHYTLEALTSLAASGLYSHVLSLIQLIFERVLKKETFSIVLEMQIYTTIVATCVSIVGLFASGEWRTTWGEMDGFTSGNVSYIKTLVWTDVAWQICSMGVIGMIFVVSSLFSNIISTLSLAVTLIASLIIFHDKMNEAKIFPMLLAFWGFTSDIYHNYLDDGILIIPCCIFLNLVIYPKFWLCSWIIIEASATCSYMSWVKCSDVHRVGIRAFVQYQVVVLRYKKEEIRMLHLILFLNEGISNSTLRLFSPASPLFICDWCIQLHQTFTVLEFRVFYVLAFSSACLCWLSCTMKHELVDDKTRDSSGLADKSLAKVTDKVGALMLEPFSDLPMQYVIKNDHLQAPPLLQTLQGNHHLEGKVVLKAWENDTPPTSSELDSGQQPNDTSPIQLKDADLTSQCQLRFDQLITERLRKKKAEGLCGLLKMEHLQLLCFYRRTNASNDFLFGV